jgi:four helix bundle protein
MSVECRMLRVECFHVLERSPLNPGEIRAAVLLTTRCIRCMREYDLEERLLEFAAQVIGIVRSMPRFRAATHIADQLLRAGTSPYGQHGEAEGAESPDDFIHKLRCCYKELREARRWLRLVNGCP